MAADLRKTSFEEDIPKVHPDLRDTCLERVEIPGSKLQHRKSNSLDILIGAATKPWNAISTILQ